MDVFQSISDFVITIAITIAIENVIRIIQGLQPNHKNRPLVRTKKEEPQSPLKHVRFRIHQHLVLLDLVRLDLAGVRRHPHLDHFEGKVDIG